MEILDTRGSKKFYFKTIRNLPVECGVEQILEFLGVHSQRIVQQGVHMVFNAQGQPSGEAFIQFDSEQSAYNVSSYKNCKFMYYAERKFILEVIQCSGEDMNLVLIGVLPSSLINYNESNNFNVDTPMLSNYFKITRKKIF